MATLKIIWLISLLTLVSNAAPPRPCSCAGGDGPTPLIPITSPIPVSLHTEIEEITDFLYLENKNKVILRDHSHDVYEMSLPSQELEYLTLSRDRLSRLVDPKEQFLVTQNGSEIYDLQNRIWNPYFVSTEAKINPLFWGNEEFYALWETMHSTPKGPTQEIEIFRYKVGTLAPYAGCKLPLQYNAQFKLAKGSSYPFVYLYKTYGVPGKYTLAIFKWDIRTCKITNATPFQGTPTTSYPGTPFTYPIKDVYELPSIDAVVTILDAPREKGNVHWSRKGECHSFDIGTDTPIFLNTTQPKIATWGAKNGLQLIDFQSQTIQKLFADVGYATAYATEKDLWLSKNGRKLLLTPRSPSLGKRQLFQIDFIPAPGMPFPKPIP